MAHVITKQGKKITKKNKIKNTKIKIKCVGGAIFSICSVWSLTQCHSWNSLPCSHQQTFIIVTFYRSPATTISFYSTSSSPEKENSSSNTLGTPLSRGVEKPEGPSALQPTTESDIYTTHTHTYTYTYIQHIHIHMHIHIYTTYTYICIYIYTTHTNTYAYTYIQHIHIHMHIHIYNTYTYIYIYTTHTHTYTYTYTYIQYIHIHIHIHIYNTYTYICMTSLRWNLFELVSCGDARVELMFVIVNSTIYSNGCFFVLNCCLYVKYRDVWHLWFR